MPCKEAFTDLLLTFDLSLTVSMLKRCLYSPISHIYLSLYVILESHQKLSFKLWLSYTKSMKDANRQVDPAYQALTSFTD